MYSAKKDPITEFYRLFLNVTFHIVVLKADKIELFNQPQNCFVESSESRTKITKAGTILKE